MNHPVGANDAPNEASRPVSGSDCLGVCPKCGSPTHAEPDGFTDDTYIVCDRSDELVEDCPGDRRRRDRRAPVWQPIETAPKDGRAVLAWEEGDEYPTKAAWRNGRWRDLELDWFDDASRPWDIVPTHWMPLPEPPQRPKEGE